MEEGCYCYRSQNSGGKYAGSATNSNCCCTICKSSRDFGVYASRSCGGGTIMFDVMERATSSLHLPLEST